MLTTRRLEAALCDGLTTQKGFTPLASSGPRTISLHTLTANCNKSSISTSEASRPCGNEATLPTRQKTTPCSRIPGLRQATRTPHLTKASILFSTLPLVQRTAGFCKLLIYVLVAIADSNAQRRSRQKALGRLEQCRSRGFLQRHVGRIPEFRVANY
jgi:hypothetical protein